MPTQLPTGVSPTTTAIHAGEARFVSHHSLTVPIVQTATYTFENTDALIAYQEDKMFWDVPERVEYGRYGNPTVYAVEAKLAALEGAEDAMLVSSGMAAITTTLMILLSQGDHFIIAEDCYRRTRIFCNSFLAVKLHGNESSSSVGSRASRHLLRVLCLVLR